MRTRLERIANGDESAVRDVIDEYGDLVWRLAKRYLDHAEGEIDDAVQDVFVEIWLSAKRFDPTKGSEASFIATIAHRRLIDHQRMTVTHRRMVRKYPDIGHLREQSIRPIRDAVHRQVAQEIASRFDDLPEPERQALWLSLHKGFTHRQISEVLGTPLGTVKTRLRRGLIRLTTIVRQNPAEVEDTKEGAM